MEYNIYDDADGDERFRSRLIVLAPVQRRLSGVLSRIIESSTESMHSVSLIIFPFDTDVIRLVC